MDNTPCIGQEGESCRKNNLCTYPDCKMTAVEWLVKELNLEGYDCTVEQAKTMEKEQRVKDYTAGWLDGSCNHVFDAETYINESNYINGK